MGVSPQIGKAEKPCTPQGVSRRSVTAVSSDDDVDRALDATMALRPYLGALTDDPAERVNGTNQAHEGQTFDYALRQRDGTWLAVEVTRAWDEQFLAAGDPWDALCTRLQATVAREHPAISGRYVVTAGLARRAKDHDERALIDAIVRCWRGGYSSSVELSAGVTVQNLTAHDAVGFRVYHAVSSAEFDLGPASQGRFARAIARKLDTLARAGDAGYETHLAVIHWAMGGTGAWRQYLADNPPAFTHPQHIWAVDLNVVPGTQGRKAAERIW
jgi:hypothetical protein